MLGQSQFQLKYQTVQYGNTVNPNADGYEKSK